MTGRFLGPEGAPQLTVILTHVRIKPPTTAPQILTHVRMTGKG